MPNLLVCAFDIECYSFDGSFSDATRSTDLITMICLSFQRLSNQDEVQSHVLTLDCASYTKPGVVVEQCASEEELLQRFACVVAERDPDILTGYNIDKFDMNYMHIRLQDKKTFYAKLSRTNIPAAFSSRTSTSAQKGSNSTARFIVPGRSTIDMLPKAIDYNSTLKLTTSWLISS